MLRVRIERWAQDHDHRVVPAPMSPDAGRTLANCIIVQDNKCASGVVDKRGHADNVVYAHAEQGTLTLYWFHKHRAPVRTQLYCAPCEDEALAPALDKLAADVELDTGHLKLDSRPQGLGVTIDEETAGETPLERELPVGSHEVALFSQGRRVAHRSIDVARGEQLELTLEAHEPEAEPLKQRWPLYLIGAGVAAMAAGAVLYATSEQPTGTRPTYRDTKPLGAIVGLGGVVVAGSGVLIGWGRAF
ncbi:MAG: PEGA domain-containing protein [Acidobacteriota bacterium]